MIKSIPTWIRSTAIAICFVLTSGCANVQYKALEKVGVHKRDILLDRIRDAQNAQTQTKDQFVSAYDEFKALASAGDETLESNYRQLAKTVEKSEQRAADLDRRINAVERVGDDLFKEWAEELDQYTNVSLRETSEKNMRGTQTRYANMLEEMHEAGARATLVLQVLQDNTLFLKHNLNASAISGLDAEVARVESHIAQLIADMERSIDTAQQFIDSG